MRTMLFTPLALLLALAGCDRSTSTQPPAPTAETAEQQAPPIDGAAEPGEPEAEPDPSDPAGATANKQPGEACVMATECQSGICEGEGCGTEASGTCADAERMCTRDAVQYCSCEGKTFVGSGSCPGQRYASKGPCQGDPALGEAK